MSIGEFLKKKRIEKFMKIKQLAEISSISDGQISRLENDEQKPGLETIINLSNALGFTLDEFLQETGYKERSFNIEKEKINETNININQNRLEELIEKATLKAIEKSKNTEIALKELKASSVLTDEQITLPFVKFDGDVKLINKVSDLMQVPKSWQNEGDFCFQVIGNSMKNYFIPDGATVLVKNQNYCKDGDIILILQNFQDGPKASLKKASYIKDILILKDSEKDLIIDDSIEIIGKVTKWGMF